MGKLVSPPAWTASGVLWSWGAEWGTGSLLGRSVKWDPSGWGYLGTGTSLLGASCRTALRRVFCVPLGDPSGRFRGVGGRRDPLGTRASAGRVADRLLSRCHMRERD